MLPLCQNMLSDPSCLCGRGLLATWQVKFTDQITSSYFYLYEFSGFKLAEEASMATRIKNTRKWFVPWTWPAGYLLDSANHCQHCLNSVFFLYASRVWIALNIQHIMQNTWGNYEIFNEKVYFSWTLHGERYPVEKGPKKGRKNRP